MSLQHLWFSIDPRTGKAIPYDIIVGEVIEEAFQRRHSSVRISVGGSLFTVHLVEMTQRNAAGGVRRVSRMSWSGTSPIALPVVGEATLKRVMALTATVDAIITTVDSNPLVPVSLNGVDMHPFVEVYDAMLAALRDPYFVLRYGGNGEDQQLCDIPLLEAVPNYFANVQTQSVYRRKVLSILGLRNLLFAGSFVFRDLQNTLFSGRVEDYEEGKGLRRMRQLTGNTVDLDTVVMNVPQYISAVNASLCRSGRAPLQDEAAFVGSRLCREAVLSAAQCQIDEFASLVGIVTEEQRRARRINLDASQPIHVARHNGDRGRVAVWQYCNVGVSTFHVNVPHMADVVGALLRCPFNLVKAFAMCMMRSPYDVLGAWCSVFDDAVSDSCFNGKWKTVEEFIHTLTVADDVPKVLFRLQAENKNLFPPSLFLSDPGRTEEMAIMKRLVNEKPLTGRDPASGAYRHITASDVDEWLALTE